MERLFSLTLICLESIEKIVMLVQHLFFDGVSIFVHFGNLGTASLTPDGEIRWKKVFSYSPVHGSGSSPVVHDDLLLFSADGASDPAIYAINKMDGSVRWKKSASSNSKKNFSFCTPLVVPRGEDFQIISPASDYVFSYSLNGDELVEISLSGRLFSGTKTCFQ